MKWRSLSFLVLISIAAVVSCKKSGDTSGANPPGTPPAPTDTIGPLGTQKDLFGSTQHSFADLLEANNKRLIFCLSRNATSTYDYFATDVRDSAYPLQKYNNEIYTMTPGVVSVCVKPDGDIMALLVKASGVGPDTVITMVVKPYSSNWQVISKVLKNTFWNNYYAGGNSIPFFATKSGRLVITRFIKAAVSDDNGLTWRETFTMPSGYQQNAGMKLSTVGSRAFIISHGSVLYSDDDFETGKISTILGAGSGGWIRNQVIQLSDARLVLLDDVNSTFYQSSNSGQSWTTMTPKDPVDSLYQYNKSYFANVDGTTIRVRAKYKPCGYFYTVDIDPVKTFKFYPVKYSCPTILPAGDYTLMSCQREDKRTYYVQSAPVGSVTSLVVRRDY